MPKKQKVRNAVRKLKQDVEARIPMKGADQGLSAYRAVGEGDDMPDYTYADTPGGRDSNVASPYRNGHGEVGAYNGEVTRTRGDEVRHDEDDAVSMDPSLSTPVHLPFGAAAFQRAVADPSFAGVDFDIDEPEGRANARGPHDGMGGGTDWRPQAARRQEDACGDDEMVVHEAGHKWRARGDGTDADDEPDAEIDGDGPFYEHGDGIELLKLRTPSTTSSGAHGHGSHGISGAKITNLGAFIHILKSYIGSGVLGLPYAYAQGGMLAAMAGMISVSVMSTLCVFLLLDCKHKLTGRVRTFGDVGFGAMGRTGHIIVELTVVLSQLGFSCAYLIFVSQNLFLYVKMALTSEASIVWTLVPILVALSWIPSLDILAPFSVLALALIFGEGKLKL